MSPPHYEWPDPSGEIKLILSADCDPGEYTRSAQTTREQDICFEAPTQI